MPRGGRRAVLDPKTCEAPTCTTSFERRPEQTTTQFRRQRFCSPTCSTGLQRTGGTGPQAMCGKGLHPMSGDNLYVRPGSGARLCRACGRAREQARNAAAAPQPVTAPKLTAARWGPDGFTPEPRTWHAGQVAS
jgi:hypothetical protein